MSHTPGPWEITDVKDGYWTGYCIRGQRTGSEEYIPIIAQVSHIANARLIAEAPELLRALKAMCNAFHQLEHETGRCPAWADHAVQLADDVLRRATEE